LTRGHRIILRVMVRFWIAVSTPLFTFQRSVKPFHSDLGPLSSRLICDFSEAWSVNSIPS
jgi:hypothetical protein